MPVAFTGKYWHLLENTGKLNYHTEIKQEGHETLNRSPEYTGQSQTFNFAI